MKKSRCDLSWDLLPKISRVKRLVSIGILAAMLPGMASAGIEVAAFRSGAELPVSSRQMGANPEVISPVMASQKLAWAASGAPTVSDPTRVTPELSEAITPTETDGESARADNVRAHMMPAVVTSEEYLLMSRQTSNVMQIGSDTTDKIVRGREGSEQGDNPPLPYALVLALLALIGLVPVSRRKP